MTGRATIAALVIVGLMGLAVHAAEKTGLLKPTNKPDTWRLEQHEQAKAAIAADGDAIVFDITNVDGEDWHAQAFQIELDLKEGKEYTVTFKAKASGDRAVKLNAGIDKEDWHFIGLDEQVDLTKDWKDYKYTFKAENVEAKKNRIGFQMGQEKGKVWVKDFSMTEK
jgi:hypothetical protein